MHKLMLEPRELLSLRLRLSVERNVPPYAKHNPNPQLQCRAYKLVKVQANARRGTYLRYLYLYLNVV